MKKNLPAVRKSRSRRVLALVLACLLALALMGTAFAHGHGHGYGHHGSGWCVDNQNHVALCTVENCPFKGQHVHNGVTYCGNYHAAGYCDGTCAASSTFVMHHHGSLHGGHHHH